MSESANFADVVTAANRIKGYATRTSLIESPFINERLGGRVLFKPECLQKTGSFKFRGAVNTINALSDKQKQKGVVAFSSGNHAQGVAHAAQLAGIPAVIIMPADAPRIKIENTRAYGAEVILYDRYNEDREAIGIRVQEERGSYLIKPYDAELTLTGQGTAGLEIAEDCKELGINPDQLLSPCGGGGLMAGLCLAMTETLPETKLYGVEPADFDDTKRSLETGCYEENDPSARSICDALLSPSPGKITFPINQHKLSGGLSVTDDEVKHAMRIAFRDLKLVVEPGGVVALAALLAGKIDTINKTTIVVLSGGNVDDEMYRSILAE
ncbi:threonine ammonia-lyase [Curvivirga aplysinae]|uniref:threonine ammonia-lyase n=1 Tax=Curvivirga aplysinae TaxID=2529852 RepID=UPI0012BC9DE4|nr:threonine/serine dehydratase [Curvivirga aplysinae]MTI08911.1 threonine/serine dehydratase [Curvivirga aplysinae]